MSVEDVLRREATKKPCSHGFCDELYPMMPICGHFIDAFTGGAYRRNICSDANPTRDMITAMNAARRDTQNIIFYSVWSDEFKMEWILSYFVAKGSVMLSKGKMSLPEAVPCSPITLSKPLQSPTKGKLRLLQPRWQSCSMAI